MKNLLKYILLFLLIADISSAQKINLTGLVIDSRNNEGESFATIVLSNNKDTIAIYADIDGNFIFINIDTGFYQMEINSIGCEVFRDSIFINSKQKEIIVKLKSNSIIDTFRIFFFNREAAISDIKNRNIRLLLPGGLISLTINNADVFFENKYNVKYFSRGCIIYAGENEAEYNLQVFKYLDKKYGHSWRKEVRADVIGFKK